MSCRNYVHRKDCPGGTKDCRARDVVIVITRKYVQGRNWAMDNELPPYAVRIITSAHELNIALRGKSGISYVIVGEPVLEEHLIDGILTAYNATPWVDPRPKEESTP